VRDLTTSNVLAWAATHSTNIEPSVEEDAGADTDEPPDNRLQSQPAPAQTQFKRTPIRRPSVQHESLLTKALQSQSDEDSNDSASSTNWYSRRRSITSTTSVASTVDFNCSTGITTPARTTSPSPRQAGITFALPSREKQQQQQQQQQQQAKKDPAVQALEKKRCISFACPAKPNTADKATVPQQQQQQQQQPAQKIAPQNVAAKEQSVAPKRTTSIKFACDSRPAKLSEQQPKETRPATPVSSTVSPSTPRPRVTRSPTATRKPSSSPVAVRNSAITVNKKFLTADPADLESECARFHEFASDEPQQDDWIRRDSITPMPKLTINDTLKKENEIRRLGKEAEEEAEMEEEEMDREMDDEELDEEVDDEALIDDDDDDFDEEDDDDVNDDEIENDQNDDVDSDAVEEVASDGYKTDNETGFAESDDEDDDLVLWTTRIGKYPLSGVVSMSRRLSMASVSSGSSSGSRRLARGRGKQRRSAKAKSPSRPETPELPDSTDFVCGTLDEDRPLEEAYISCVEARKRSKQKPIPQDIDPSFPASEPEDSDDGICRRRHVYGDSSDHLWFHGPMEDLHHDRDHRKGLRGRKKDTCAAVSPKRCRSPPPKRRGPSPAPKPRARSPRKGNDQRSPRYRSPAPPRMASRSPMAVSPADVPLDGPVVFKPVHFGGPTSVANHTKSLPPVAVLFPNLQPVAGQQVPPPTRRATAFVPRESVSHHMVEDIEEVNEEDDADNNNGSSSTHVRGAIDIVKGLEQKRQRRKEKFFQKYYERARKEAAQGRRAAVPPGTGAERMRELGLLMAGKREKRYMLSF